MRPTATGSAIGSPAGSPTGTGVIGARSMYAQPACKGLSHPIPSKTCAEDDTAVDYYRAVDTLPHRNFKFEVLTGRRGRVKADAEFFDLFTVVDTYHPHLGPTPVIEHADGLSHGNDLVVENDIGEERTRELAVKIIDAADALHEAGGWDFTSPIGKYTVPVVTIDWFYQVRTLVLPMNRPVNETGGHTLTPKAEDIAKLLKATRSDSLTREIMDTTEYKVVFCTLNNFDVLFAMDPSMILPRLIHKLNVVKKNRRTAIGIEVRVSDGNVLGKSPPHLSDVKFNALFPEQSIDTSGIVTAEQRPAGREAGTSSAPAKKRAKKMSALQTLTASFLDQQAGAAPQDQARLGYIAHLLNTLHGIDPKHFEKTFGALVNMDPAIHFAMFSNREFLRGVVAGSCADEADVAALEGIIALI